MEKRIKIFLKFSLFAAVFCLAHFFCKKETDGFQLFKIRSELPFHPEWDISYSEKELAETRQALNQPFHYMGKGAQSFVFASSDGKYVLKFFRQHHLRPSLLVEYLVHFPFFHEKFQEKIARKEREIQTDFMSYKIAYTQLKEETGLVFVHLNKTNNLHIKTPISDKLHIHHLLDMDNMEFLLQKRATLLYDAVDALLANHKMEELKEILASLVELLSHRCKLGILDKDPDLNTNFGILDNKPLQIDVGRFRKKPEEKDPTIFKEELIRITDNLRRRICITSPEMAQFVLDKIDAL